jgi:signal transduction histidine kinase
VHGRVLRLEIRDDGRGISTTSLASRSSLGLLGIRERARRVGATASIGNVGYKGTVVTVELPLGRARGTS